MKNKNLLLVFLIALIVIAVLIVVLDTGKTYTRREIQQIYQIDGLSSEACKSDPYSQACLDVWNKCNGNPQKPVEERVIGCFDHYTMVSPDLSPIIELTGFTSEFPQGETDPNKVVYRLK